MSNGRSHWTPEGRFEIKVDDRNINLNLMIVFKDRELPARFLSYRAALEAIASPLFRAEQGLPLSAQVPIRLEDWNNR